MKSQSQHQPKIKFWTNTRK